MKISVDDLKIEFSSLRGFFETPSLTLTKFLLPNIDAIPIIIPQEDICIKVEGALEGSLEPYMPRKKFTNEFMFNFELLIY